MIFSRNLLAIEIKKTHTDILMNKPVYLHLSIIRNKENSNVWVLINNVKPKYREKAKLSYIDLDSFIVYIKIKDLLRHCKRCWNKIW